MVAILLLANASPSSVGALTLDLYSVRSWAMMLLVAANTHAWIVVEIIGEGILNSTDEYCGMKVWTTKGGFVEVVCTASCVAAFRGREFQKMPGDVPYSPGYFYRGL